MSYDFRFSDEPEPNTHVIKSRILGRGQAIWLAPLRFLGEGQLPPLAPPGYASANNISQRTADDIIEFSMQYMFHYRVYTMSFSNYLIITV